MDALIKGQGVYLYIQSIKKQKKKQGEPVRIAVEGIYLYWIRLRGEFIYSYVFI